MQVLCISTDAYGAIVVQAQGADLQPNIISIYAGDFPRLYGNVQQDPSGFVSRYLRPNPNSTAGIFVTVMTPIWQGFGMPYAPTVKVQTSLLRSSTQETAQITGQAMVVAITNKKLFIQSLRRVLDANASLKIDPELLALGPQPFEKNMEKEAEINL
jgi:hypothetical protein